MSVRAALGGRWAASFSGWLVLLLPSTLLVVLQETSLGASGVLPAVALGLAEHVAAGALGALAIWPAQRRWPTLSLTYVFAVWAAMGATRGLVWAAWHVWVLNGDAELGYRVILWTSISVVWSPIFVYMLAQVDRRRMLLATLDAVRMARTSSQARLAQSARDRRRALLSTLQTTIGPVIAELRHSLAAIAPKLTAASAEAMAARVSTLALETARLVRDDLPHAPDSTITVQRAPFSASLDFPVNRPVVAALLTGIAMIPLFVPDVLRVHGVGFALTVLGALGFVVVLQALVVIVLRFTRPKLGRPSSVAVVFAFLLPGAVGSAFIAAVPGAPAPHLMIALLVILPVASLFAGCNVAGAVGLAHSNTEIATHIDAIRAEIQRLEELADEADRRVRSQLEQLMHGPVYGRLSACVMALNFHAEEIATGVPVHGESTVDKVVSYLEATSRDLDSLISN